MTHLELIRKKQVAPFRKLAIGTWQTAYDPTVYGGITLRMDRAMEYIERFRAATGRRLTITHLVTKACAEALRRVPDANAILRFNKLYLRKHINISVLVVQTDQGEGDPDLTAAKVNDADQKNLVQIVDELEATVEKVRTRQDKGLESGKATVAKVPFILMNAFLKLIAFLLYTLNIDLTFAGMPRDAFGSLTVTNIGSLGLETGFVPLVPYTRVPIFISPGIVKEAPVVENGKLAIGKVMQLNASFDHRFIDGYHAMVLAKTIREMLENPFEKFDDLSKLPEAKPAASV